MQNQEMLAEIFFLLQPITNSPPKWMAELENEDIEMLKGLLF